MTALEDSVFGATRHDAAVRGPSAMAALETELNQGQGALATLEHPPTEEAIPTPQPAATVQTPAPAPTGINYTRPAAPQVQAAASPGDGQNPIAMGFRSGMAGQNVRGSGQFMQDLGALIESERLDRWGQTLEAMGKRHEEPARVGRLRDIRSPRDAAEYAGYQVGQGVASSLPSLVAGGAGVLAGGAVGGPVGAAIGGAAGAAATSYVQNEGDISQELEDLGMTDPKERARNAMRIAVPVAALDVLPTGRLLRLLTAGRAPVEIAKRGLVHGLARIGLETAKQTAAEGLTEGIQEGIQYVGARVAAQKPMNALEGLERALEATVAGGLAGGVMGAGEASLNELRGNPEDEAAKETPPPVEKGPADTPPAPPGDPGSGALAAMASLLDDTQPAEEPGAPGADPTPASPTIAPAPPEAVAGPPSAQGPGGVYPQPVAVSRETPPPAITTQEGQAMLGRAQQREAEANALAPAPDLSGYDNEELVQAREAADAQGDLEQGDAIDAEIDRRMSEAMPRPDRPPQTPAPVDFQAKIAQQRADQGRTAPKKSMTQHIYEERQAADAAKAKPNKYTWTRNPEEAVKNGWTKIPDTDQVALQEENGSIRVRNLATGEEGIHLRGSRDAERLREQLFLPLTADLPTVHGIPDATVPPVRKKSPTPQVEHGVAGPDAKYVLPTFATTGQPKGAEPTLEELKAEREQVHQTLATGNKAERGLAANRLAQLDRAIGKKVQAERGANPQQGTMEDVWQRIMDQQKALTGGRPFDQEWQRQATPVQRARMRELQKEQAEVERRIRVRNQTATPAKKVTPPLAAPKPKPDVESAPVAPVGTTTTPEERSESAAHPEEAPNDRAPTDREPAPGPVREGVAGRREAAADAHPAAREGSAEAGPVVPAGGRSGGGGDHVAADEGRPAADREPAPDAEGREPPAKGQGGSHDTPPRHARTAGDLAGGNYRLTDADKLGQGPPSQKSAGNLAAITLLKQLEQAGRPATTAEQAVLAKYVGWGGLADAFDPRKDGYLPQLKELLTEAEYASAKASTPNAHYTSVEVIRAIFDALTAMGVQGGKLLEPSMGTGNFLGLTPATWRARWSGVELDAITGRIGKLLYPQANIQVAGFETVKAPDKTFDVAISNVPFGNYGVSDRRYEKQGKFLTRSIHNYFFAKALDLVRPGGLVAFITSRYTLDSAGGDGRAFRDYIAAHASFLGAVRLPSLAFKENADTEVVTDVIFLQRYPEGELPLGEGRVGTGNYLDITRVDTPNGSVEINGYFKENPNNIVGTVTTRTGRYNAHELTVTVDPEMYPQLLRTTFARMVAKLRGVYQPAAIESPATTDAAEEAALEAPGDVKEGGFAVRAGALYQRFDGKLKPAEVPKAALDRVTRLVTMIEDLRGLIQAERLDRPAADVESRRTKLRERYRTFVKKYGPITKEVRTSYISKRTGKEVVITSFPNLKIARDDPSSSFLFALEHSYDEETGKATEGGILSHRTVKPERSLDRVDTVADALPYVLGQVGRVDMTRIAALAGTTEDEAARALFQQGLVFDDPANLGEPWVPADEYLSGDVRAKLVLAREAEKREPRFKAHREALEKVIPEDLTPGQIHVSAGAPWIPTTDVEAFARALAGRGSADVRYLAHDGSWHITGDWQLNGSAAAQADWGTDRIRWTKLLELAFNNKAPLITDPKPGGEGRVKNLEATVQAEAKWQNIKDRFAAWIWEDAKRADRLVRYYNDHFNNIRLWEPNGEHLTFPGQTKMLRGSPFALDPHQRNAAWRIVRGGNTLLAHVVGAGKSFTMQAAGMEAKRLGLAKKPMYAVPPQMLGQFAREFRELYPSAQLLIAETEDVSAEGRARFQAKATGSNWDGIIIAHPSFEKVRMGLEFQERFLTQQLAELEQVIHEEKEAGNRKSDTVKDVEKAKKRLLAKIDKLRADWKKDEALEFEALGVDMLFVDEAHLFKNLWIASSRRGVAMDGSQRAFDLYLKTRYLDEQRPGWGVTFATGTPIANSVGEMFTMQRYLQQRVLDGHGINHFDGWASTFGEDVTGLEMKPDGSGYRMKTRFARFKNVPELIRMFRQVADVKLAEDLNLKTPKLLGGKALAVVSRASAKLKAYIQKLLTRAQNLDPQRPDLDNWLKIVGDGRHAALDIRFADADPVPDPEGKIAHAARQIVELWEETGQHKGTQLVFSDLGTPKSDAEAKKVKRKVVDADGNELEDDESGEGFQVSPRGGVLGFNIYGALKDALIAQGIPAEQIVFIHEANTEAKKLRLFADVNSGKVRVVIGSTEKMGAGLNVQARLVAEHHLDAPWRPADVEQREGRILRQGNLLYNSGAIEGVRIFRYVTEESFDAFMWSTLERKAFMIGQVMKGDLTVREIEDLDSPVVADFAQMKAITSGNPAVMEKAQVDAEIQKLDRLRKGHLDQQFRIRQELLNLPKRTEYWSQRAERIRADIAHREDTTGDAFAITIGGKAFTKRPEAGVALREALGAVLARHAQAFQHVSLSIGTMAVGGLDAPQPVGTFAGFPVMIQTLPSSLARAELVLVGQEQAYTRSIDGQDSAQSLLSTLEHIAGGLERDLKAAETEVLTAYGNTQQLEERVGRPFEHDAKLAGLLKRQAALNAQLTKIAKLETNPQGTPENLDVEDKGDEDEGPGGLEFRETFPGGLPDQIRKLLAQKAAREKALLPFTDPAIEAEYQAAKGLKKAPLSEQLARAVERLREMARHFPAIDPSAGPLEARTNQILLEIEGAQSWAQAQAIHRIRTMLKGLTEPEVDLLTRHFVLGDLAKDLEDGLYDGRTLPFGFTAEQLPAEMERVRQAVSTNPKVARAIALRTSHAQALTQALVAADQLPASVLEDPRYYHRQVLEYFNAEPPATQRPGTSASEARVHRKGFQKARVGGGEFNTRFHEAEFEWMAQAHRILHMVEKLEEIQQLADVQGRLKAEAKQLNAAALVGRSDAESLVPFNQRIARATGELYQLAEHGELNLPGFEHMIAQLAQAYAEWKAQPRRQRGEGPRPSFRFNHPQWFSFLKRILDNGSAGKIQAAVIFKALHEREEAVKQLLGRQYRTWEDLVPPGYRTWQPVKGNHFFQALGIAERALQQFLAGERTLGEADFREMLVLGPARDTWVIPEWLATTMDEFAQPHDTKFIGRVWQGLITQWKRYQLLNPLRLLKYNFNNFSGDLDATLLAPGIHTFTKSAVADLWAFRGQSASPQINAEVLRWMQLRVIDQGLSVAEIPDLSEISGFAELSNPNPFRFMYWVSKYWRKARGLTLFRENVFRLAAARYYLAHPEARGPASNLKELSYIRDAHQRAAKLSRDLLGDYGNISEAGTWARTRIMPFFSWQEINAVRYVRAIKNSFHQDLAPAERAGARGFLAKRTAGYVLRRLIHINAFFLLLSLWNRLFFPDEDDELRERGRNLHLILGRYQDGSIRSIRIEGAWADFLEWLHLHDYPADIKDLQTGRRSPWEKIQEMARSPLEKIIGLWEPIAKTGLEVATKRATYPTPFDSRPIRDRWEHVMQSVSLGWLYRKVTDKPVPPGSAYTQFLLVRTDPGEAAFFGIKQRVGEWLEKQGKERGSPDPTPRDNALYYWRKALEWGEEKQADRWLQRYFALGGTRESAKESIKRQRPLKELNQHDRSRFLQQLDGQGKEMLKMANQWYLRGLRATSGPSLGRTPQAKGGPK